MKQITYAKQSNRNKRTEPLVSVLMPVHNAGDFLGEAIESILNQSESNFELFIIDDGSTDNSWKIISGFARKDKRIKPFRNETNKGLVKSLNSLIPLTKGKFIARMDADDISLPDRFEKQIALLESDLSLVAVGGQEKIIDEKGKTIARKYFPTDKKTAYNILMNIMVIQPPLLMARGDIFRKLRYDNHLFKNDDITMHFKLLKNGDFGNVDKVIFKYRYRPNSLTHKDPKYVYMRALLVRFNAIRKYGYRPSIVNILLTVPETLLVLFLPNHAILNIFSQLRHSLEVQVSLAQKAVASFVPAIK